MSKSERSQHIELLFEPGETIAVCSQFFDAKFHQAEAPPQDGSLQYLCVNPLVAGTKHPTDVAVSAYRTFINESDDIPLAEQEGFYKSIELPTSARVYSGGRSIHIYTVLDSPLPSKEEYDSYAFRIQTVLRSLAAARYPELATCPKLVDPSVKNCSTWARLAGGTNKKTGYSQPLLHVGERVSLEAIKAWLNRFEEKPAVAPLPIRKPVAVPLLASRDKGRIALHTEDLVRNGADYLRNNSVFKASRDLHQNNYSIEEALELIESAPNLVAPDFSVSELRRTVRSAFRTPPKHPPRIDHNDSLSNFIERSFYILDMNSETHSFVLFSPEEARTERPTEKAILAAVGKNRFDDLRQNRTIVARFVYEPYKKQKLFIGEDGVSCFNTYEPPAWARDSFYFGAPIRTVSECPSLFARLLNHLFDADEPSIEFVKDWLTNAIHRKNQTYLCAIGVEGAGKGTLSDVIANVIGPTNFVKVRDEIVKGRFNASLRNKRLVHIDEIKLRDEEQINRLKDLVNDTIEIERKGIDTESVRNYASIYISTNNLDAITLSPTDRRFSIVQISEDSLLKSMTEKEIVDLKYDSELHNEIALWLFGRTITSNLNKPFRGARFEDVREATLKDWERSLLYEVLPKFAGQKVDQEMLQAEIKIKNPNQAPPGRTKLENLARRFPERLRHSRDSSGRYHVEVKKA